MCCYYEYIAYEKTETQVSILLKITVHNLQSQD